MRKFFNYISGMLVGFLVVLIAGFFPSYKWWIIGISLVVTISINIMGRIAIAKLHMKLNNYNIQDK